MSRWIPVACLVVASFATINAEEGAECLVQCLHEAARLGQQSGRQQRSVPLILLAKRAVPIGESLDCEQVFVPCNLVVRYAIHKKSSVKTTVRLVFVFSNLPFKKCAQVCPSSKLDAVARDLVEMNAKYCHNPEAIMSYLNGMLTLNKEWLPKMKSCFQSMAAASDTDDLCRKTALCILGTLEDIHGQVPDDSMTAVVDSSLIGFGTSFMRRHGSDLPQTCDVLFEPYRRGRAAVTQSPNEGNLSEAKFRHFLSFLQRQQMS